MWHGTQYVKIYQKKKKTVLRKKKTEHRKKVLLHVVHMRGRATFTNETGQTAVEVCPPRCAPTSYTAGYRSNRMQSKIKARQHYFVCTIATKRESKCAHTASLATERLHGCGYGGCLAVGSGRLSLPKHIIDNLGVTDSKHCNASGFPRRSECPDMFFDTEHRHDETFVSYSCFGKV